MEGNPTGLGRRNCEGAASGGKSSDPFLREHEPVTVDLGQGFNGDGFLLRDLGLAVNPLPYKTLGDFELFGKPLLGQAVALDVVLEFRQDNPFFASFHMGQCTRFPIVNRFFEKCNMSPSCDNQRG